MVTKTGNGNGKTSVIIALIALVGVVLTIAYNISSGGQDKVYKAISTQQDSANKDRARMALLIDQNALHNQRQDSCMVAFYYELKETKHDAAVTRGIVTEIFKELGGSESTLRRIENAAVDSMNRDTVRDTTR